jgi:uncharacterized protein YutE (UPF0331/DUF86 family)
MKLDRERIKHLLYEIKEDALDLENTLTNFSDEKIIADKTKIKSIKYTLVEISEAISLALQHIIAKRYGQPVKGYVDTVIKASNLKIISEDLSQKLKPFLDFRNSLIHRYWSIDNETLIQNCRKGYMDFYRFIAEIEEFVKKGK